MIKINAGIDFISGRSALSLEVFLEKVFQGVLKVSELIMGF